MVTFTLIRFILGKFHLFLVSHEEKREIIGMKSLLEYLYQLEYDVDGKVYRTCKIATFTSPGHESVTFSP